MSESSLKRWCDQGLLPTRRTAGGHRRLPVSGVLRFLRERGYDIERPELLGLPARLASQELSPSHAARELTEMLVEGQSEMALRLVLGMFVAGKSVCELFDAAVAPALHQIGSQWEDQGLEIYREHRAFEITRRILQELRRLLQEPSPTAPKAITATLEGDPYSLPISMVELVLVDAGWRAESLGPSHPVDTLIAAIDDIEPAVLVLNVSHLPSQTAFLEQYEQLYAHARKRRVAVIVGGQGLDDDLRARMRFTAYGQSMKELVDFADGVWRRQ